VISRRQFLVTATAAAAATTLTSACARREEEPWDRSAYHKPSMSRVLIARAADYSIDLADLIGHAIRQFGLAVVGKRVVLKPNLVEFDPSNVINTHPALVGAAIDAFRRLGAREVVVAEGPGHRRDNEYLLTASGLWDILRERHVEYLDLNFDDTRSIRTGSRFTQLGQLALPQTVLGADLLVSMPKLKTHHWAGVTLSLKNLFGVIPGAVYGWPKNVLHWAGLNESIVDIQSTIPVPQFAIVDGIVGMEGNGPIQGQAKHAGVLLFGDDLVATDATSARLMNIEPSRVRYLAMADRFLGNTALERITLIGESLEKVQQNFRLIEMFRHLAASERTGAS
jgi:uncharacterized protein (DUF362 family)